MSFTDFFSTVRSKWEQELGFEIEEELWSKILKKIHSSSYCPRLSLIQFRLVHRAYLCNARLASIYPGVNSLCPRCGKEPATLLHMFWSCLKLEKYWKAVFSSLNEAFGSNVSPNPLLILFGVQVESSLMSNVAEAQKFALLLAKRRILLGWKASTAPSHARWLTDVMFFLNLEKIKFRCRI